MSSVLADGDDPVLLLNKRLKDGGYSKITTKKAVSGKRRPCKVLARFFNKNTA